MSTKRAAEPTWRRSSTSSQTTSTGPWTTGTAAQWYDRRVGMAGVANYFQDIARMSEVLEFTRLSFVGNDDEVHTLVRYRVRFTTTGRKIDMNLHHCFRFRDANVAYVRASEDTA
jgi:ketosteroid isomerase-like protein